MLIWNIHTYIHNIHTVTEILFNKMCILFYIAVLWTRSPSNTEDHSIIVSALRYALYGYLRLLLFNTHFIGTIHLWSYLKTSWLQILSLISTYLFIYERIAPIGCVRATVDYCLKKFIHPSYQSKDDQLWTTRFAKQISPTVRISNFTNFILITALRFAVYNELLVPTW